MSTESRDAAAFVERLKTDEAFRNRFGAGLVSPEQLVERAGKEGYRFTEAALQQAILAATRISGGGDGTLSDDEMDSIAGGILRPLFRQLGLWAAGGRGRAEGRRPG